MCGFLGWFKAEPRVLSVEDRELASECLAGIAHRGQDDSSEASQASWWMGFRRLAILDLSEAGRQPMTFGGGRFTLTFNGEIYNYRQLREGLPELGSTGDSVVLGTLLSVATEAASVLGRLRGMFAFAWWDQAERQLLVARDHFGIKPLFYALTKQGDLVYGSELRAVVRLLGGAEINREALSHYLQWGAVQAPATLFKGVHCLPPGHLLRWQAGRVQVERYFTPVWPADRPTMSEEAQVEDTRTTVLQSIGAHLVSDVPVGVFLSGGLDSTIMAAAMRHLGQSQVQAFSIGYEQGAGVPDESHTAERTAQYLGCQFVRHTLTPGGLLGQLDGYFGSLDQPTGDALNTYLVSQVAAQHVKVALSGLGADEWFAGYNHHRLIALAQRSPLIFLRGLGVKQVGGLLPAQLRGHKAWKALSYGLGGAGATVAEQQAFGRSILSSIDVERWTGQKAPVWPEALVPEGSDWMQELLLRETQGYLANTLLRDNDCTSMAHSLELRVPLVDREVFALAGRVSPGMKLRGGVGKYALRKALADLLPPWIADDRQKKTFTLPLMRWMREPRWQERIRDTLGPAARIHAYLDRVQTQQRLDGYFASSAGEKSAWHLSQPLWLLLVMEEWLRKNAQLCS
jgi:asparagine synthase (glutamine-hydrolysing)